MTQSIKPVLQRQRTLLRTSLGIRHQLGKKELYRKRSETTETVFADAKEKYGMRYTRLRGLRRVHHHLMLLFACMNLKKLTMWKKQSRLIASITPRFTLFIVHSLPKEKPVSRFGLLKTDFVYSLKRPSTGRILGVVL